MGYMQQYLEGDGTEKNPFLITSYSDWMTINPNRSADMDPPYYKMMTDINMDNHGEYWKPTDFADANLNMNGHSILSPRIPTGYYLIKNANIYSNELAYVEDDGSVNETDYGQFLNIYGANVQYIFADCSFSRILCDVNAKGMWINSDNERIGLFTRVTTNQSHFKITNEGYEKVIFTSKKLEDRDAYPFVDTLFEFMGEAYEVPFIAQGYKDADSADELMSHCLVSGELDVTYMIHDYKSSSAVMFGGRIQSCIIYLRCDSNPDHKGYRGFADYVDVMHISLALTEEDSNIYAVNQENVIRVSDANLRNPNYLLGLGFDLIKV